MSVHLIGYSRGWLCDCQRLTERGERDNGKKPESAVVFLLPCFGFSPPFPSSAASSRLLPLLSPILCATWTSTSHDISPGSDEITAEG